MKHLLQDPSQNKNHDCYHCYTESQNEANEIAHCPPIHQPTHPPLFGCAFDFSGEKATIQGMQFGFLREAMYIHWLCQDINSESAQISSVHHLWISTDKPRISMYYRWILMGYQRIS